MRDYKYLIINSFLIIIYIVFVQGEQEEWSLQNMDDECMGCICEAASSCDLSSECKGGYCGAFRIARVYWVDAGNITIALDDPARSGAYEDCTAYHFDCAKRVVKGYLKKFARDCNGDGVTDCLDFLMIHLNGGLSCNKPLETSVHGAVKLERYLQCMEGSDDLDY